MSLFHAYKLLFLCRLIGGELTPSAETPELGFFALDALPQPLSPHRTTPRHLSDAIASLDDPALPTVFD
jgi:hypothetical protein